MRKLSLSLMFAQHVIKLNSDVRGVFLYSLLLLLFSVFAQPVVEMDCFPSAGCNYDCALLFITGLL